MAAQLHGTLDMIILRTLLRGPAHGHGITRLIQQTSADALRVDHGSLYPALHRLEKRGWIDSRWENTDRGREMRFYRLTRSGRKQLQVEESNWNDLVAAIGRILQPAEE